MIYLHGFTGHVSAENISRAEGDPTRLRENQFLGCFDSPDGAKLWKFDCADAVGAQQPMLQHDLGRKMLRHARRTRSQCGKMRVFGRPGFLTLNLSTERPVRIQTFDRNRFKAL